MSIRAEGLAHDELVEVRPSYPVGGEIVWRWSVWDHLIQDFDPEKANYGDVAAHPERVDLNYALAELFRTDKQADRTDWLHANALDYHAELDQILISARNFSEIWVVDHSATQKEAAGRTGGRSGRGGDLLYRWGNPRAYRAGTTAQQQLFWPHSAHWIPAGLPGAGNILVFNNGDEFEGFERNYSTVVEFEYPLADGKAPARGEPPPPRRPLWEYVGDPPESFFSQRTSSTQRLANGNTLVLAGLQGTVFRGHARRRDGLAVRQPARRDGGAGAGRPGADHAPPQPLGVGEHAVPRAQVRAGPSRARRARPDAKGRLGARPQARRVAHRRGGISGAGRRGASQPPLTTRR